MDDRIKNVLNHIEGHLDQALNLKELAELACLSPSQFHRVFKKETARTPFQFVEEIKMARAYQVLLQDTTGVGDLAGALGYKDYETLTRAFKKHYHFSPDDFRAIVVKLKQTFAQSEEVKVIIRTVDTAAGSQGELEEIKKLMSELQLSEADLQEAGIYRIVRASEKDSIKGPVVRNKFALLEEDCIWQKLMEEAST